MINLFKKISYFLFTLLLIPSVALAADTEIRADLPGGSSSYTNLADYVHDFYIYAIWLITAVSVIMIVYGGYTMIISSGNPEQINKGRSTIISALVSLGLLVLAYTVLRIISPQIVENTPPTPTTTTTTPIIDPTPPVEIPPSPPMA